MNAQTKEMDFQSLKEIIAKISANPSILNSGKITKYVLEKAVKENPWLARFEQVASRISIETLEKAVEKDGYLVVYEHVASRISPKLLHATAQKNTKLYMRNSVASRTDTAILEAVIKENPWRITTEPKVLKRLSAEVIEEAVKAVPDLATYPQVLARISDEAVEKAVKASHQLIAHDIVRQCISAETLDNALVKFKEQYVRDNLYKLPFNAKEFLKNQYDPVRHG